MEFTHTRHVRSVLQRTRTRDHMASTVIVALSTIWVHVRTAADLRGRPWRHAVRGAE